MALQLRELGTAHDCASCASELTVGTVAWWDEHTDMARCQRCATDSESPQPAPAAYAQRVVALEQRIDLTWNAHRIGDFLKLIERANRPV